MLSLSSSQLEPSALLSNARITIETLIQRPSTITTSNAFDEFSILDRLIDVSNDVDRLEDGESRKFLNIAQLITASTCIYSRRVDALYKLINSFQSSSANKHDEHSLDNDSDQLPTDIVQPEDESQSKKLVQEKKKKIKENHRSFICHDSAKININSSKNFFVDNTSMFDLKLFQNHVPLGNKQFWIDDYRPWIFNLLFHDQFIGDIEQNYLPQPEPFIDELHQLSPIKPLPTFNGNDIPLPIPACHDLEASWNNENSIEPEPVQFIEKKKPSTNNNRKKRAKTDIGLNLFRAGLTDEEQQCFRFHKMKPLSNKIKVEQPQFFIKKFSRHHFDRLIQDCSATMVSIFIYPTITVQYLTIRERYSLKINEPTLHRESYSPSVPIAEVLNDNMLISTSPARSFIEDYNQDIYEDVDVRLQTGVEQIVEAATHHSNEEQEHNQIYLELRSSITLYMNEHESMKRINVDDLLESLNDHYSLPLIFSQLLHLCATTQRHHLYSTSNDTLFIEKRNDADCF